MGAHCTRALTYLYNEGPENVEYGYELGQLSPSQGRKEVILVDQLFVGPGLYDTPLVHDVDAIGKGIPAPFCPIVTTCTDEHGVVHFYIYLFEYADK